MPTQGAAPHRPPSPRPPAVATARMTKARGGGGRGRAPRRAGRPGLIDRRRWAGRAAGVVQGGPSRASERERPQRRGQQPQLQPALVPAAGRRPTGGGAEDPVCEGGGAGVPFSALLGAADSAPGPPSRAAAPPAPQGCALPTPRRLARCSAAVLRARPRAAVHLQQQQQQQAQQHQAQQQQAAECADAQPQPPQQQHKGFLPANVVSVQGVPGPLLQD
ncbi:Protein of unknown function [Gryllus bimaculatus]|nr:Protein of unknown function [Gryllus bimaculatus]